MAQNVMIESQGKDPAAAEALPKEAAGAAPGVMLRDSVGTGTDRGEVSAVLEDGP